MKALLTRARPDLVGCALLLVAILWTLYRTGARPFVMLGQQVSIASVWPSISSESELGANYTWASPSGFAVARLVGIPGETSFLFQQAAAILLGIGIMSLVLRRELSSKQSWRASRFLILGSLGAVLIHWLGIYDSYTFLFWTIFLLVWSFNSTLGILVAGFLLGFQHFNQGLFGLAAFWIVAWALSRKPVRSFVRLAVTSLVGLAMGKLTQIVIYIALQVNLSTTTFGREAIAFSFSQFETEMRLSLSYLPVLLWSTFAGLWLVVLLVFAQVPRKRQVILGLTFALLFLLAAMAGDKTRVFVMMAFPLMLLFVLEFFRSNADRRTINLIEAALWLTYPLILFHKWILPTGWPESLLDEFLNLPTFFI